MSTFEALVLMISFSTLIVSVISLAFTFTRKK
ncbi:putative holin-like toxin [Ferdinandcohnia quinoae]|uniref:Holin-like toxin n=1 Tax=Fredinandcohnia quinoae TaxID=2918902 RepID=A0AAW5EDQ9_9BACI|nr:putative holin-like toxin [Fredinandcohnia sp. SECRCQ15]MCH1627865.1 putative holin-like toxin [Fredinandcohnia sp. SECRCQ15]